MEKSKRSCWIKLLALLALPHILEGCVSASEVASRLNSEPLTIDQFYTTSLSGEVKEAIEAEQARHPRSTSASARMKSTPPQVSSFAAGETVCVAVHSQPGDTYKYSYESGNLGNDPYGRETYSYESGMTTLEGSGEANINGTEIYYYLFVGGLGGWYVDCDAVEKDKSFPIVRRKPDRHLRVDQLSPGQYKIVFIAKERYTERKHKLRTRFTVE